MQVFEELQARGLLAQLTDEAEIRDLVNNGGATFYIGFDPTADSLHVGHFMALCLMNGSRWRETSPWSSSEAAPATWGIPPAGAICAP